MWVIQLIISLFFIIFSIVALIAGGNDFSPVVWIAGVIVGLFIFPKKIGNKKTNQVVPPKEGTTNFTNN